MPYITKDEVKTIRLALKKAVPNLKLSVRKEHDMSVRVAVVKGDIDFGVDYDQVNHFYIKNHWNGNPKACEALEKIYNTIRTAHEQREITYDGDYGSVPNYYINITIGKWDKPYQLV
jgi:hypothetical protein